LHFKSREREKPLRTQIGIVGAGPAGLVLAHLLHLHGIESVVIEARSRKYIEERVRAGLLEQGTVDLLIETGVGERLKRECLTHHGIALRFNRQSHRIDFNDLTGGKTVTIYAQQEVIKDLVVARLNVGLPIIFEVDEVSVHGFDSANPSIRFQAAGKAEELHCDYIAGCDGFHGICRPSIPAGVLTEFDREYPFGWLGILAYASPSSDELVYCYHERGFALLTMRTREVSRLYLQVPHDEDIDNWSDDRIWSELRVRTAADGDWKLNEGEIFQKNIAGMRSYVVEPMQYGKMFLAGDAAHIVPPTGAKGLNLAVADVRIMAQGFAEFYATGRTRLLEQYSETCLRRVWKAQRFSWWMTSMLHRFDTNNAFDERRQIAELDYVTSSRAAMTSLAENYVGLPWD
jgi:p-hydroxybenzoate 3-monooxygenase